MTGWQEASVDDVKSDAKSAIAIGPFGSRLKSDQYSDSGIPVIRGANLTGGREFAGQFVFIPDELASSMPGCNVFEGDLVFPHRGAIGEVGIVREGRYFLSTSLMKLTVDKRRVDPRWLYYFFRSAQGRAELTLNASQVGTPGIARPLNSLRSVRLRLPPLHEQRGIADTLDCLNDKIEQNRQTARTLEELAQRLFKSWFVDFDPVRAKMAGRQPAHTPPEIADLFPDRLVDSPLGLIPEGWEVAQLGDIAENVRDSVKAEEIQSDAIYVGLEHFAAKSLMLAQVGLGEEVTSNKSRFQRGDLLFGKLRPYFHKISVAHTDGICSTDVLVIRPKTEALKAYSYLGFFQESVVDYATQRSTGTRMPRANWKTLSEFPVALPPTELQHALDTLVLPMIEIMFMMVNESETLAQLRDRLLPKLISGEIRVPARTTETEDAL